MLNLFKYIGVVVFLCSDCLSKSVSEEQPKLNLINVEGMTYVEAKCGLDQKLTVYLFPANHLNSTNYIFLSNSKKKWIGAITFTGTNVSTISYSIKDNSLLNHLIKLAELSGHEWTHPIITSGITHLTENRSLLLNVAYFPGQTKVMASVFISSDSILSERMLHVIPSDNHGHFAALDLNKDGLFDDAATWSETCFPIPYTGRVQINNQGEWIQVEDIIGTPPSGYRGGINPEGIGVGP